MKSAVVFRQILSVRDGFSLYLNEVTMLQFGAFKEDVVLLLAHLNSPVIGGYCLCSGLCLFIQMHLFAN